MVITLHAQRERGKVIGLGVPWLYIVSRAPDSFGKESGNFSCVSERQCRNVDTTI